MAAVTLNGKEWGFIDKSGKEMVPLKYDQAITFHEGLARVIFNNKYGFVDKNGKEVISLIYDYAHRCSNGLIARPNNKWGFIDKQAMISSL